MSKLFRPAVAVFASALLGLAFAGCGASGGGGAVATVNGEDISRADFDTKLENGPSGKQVLSQLIQQKLVDQYAAQQKIDISDADIAKREDQIKSKYPSGQFEQILKQQGLTEDDVKKLLRQELVIKKSVDKDITVTDAQIKDYFDKNHAAYDKPERARARHILVADEKTANEIEGKLKGGAKFEDLAKQYSTDPGSKDKGGELGFFVRGQMVPAFEKVAFSAPLNKVQPPVHSPFGYHVIEVEERTSASKATLTSAHDDVKDALMQQAENMKIPAFMADLRGKAKLEAKDARFADVVATPAPTPPGQPNVQVQQGTPAPK